MPDGKREQVKPGELLYQVRKSVSEILGKHFTENVDHRIFQPDKRILAVWALDCAEHVLPYFENEYPGDDRPRLAIDTLRKWLNTGIFSMAVIREASLSAHDAARGKPVSAATFAAHAAGQAVAAAHVPTHALGASVYAIRAAAARNMDDGLEERSRQLERLREHVRHNRKC